MRVHQDELSLTKVNYLPYMISAAVLSTSAYFFKWAETLFNGPICFILSLTSVVLPIVAVSVQKKHVYSGRVFVWTILLFNERQLELPLDDNLR